MAATAPAPQEPAAPRVAERSLLDRARALYERRWAVYSSAGLVLLLVALFTFAAQPVYRATAILQIEKDNPNVLAFQDVVAIDSRDELFYQTQYRLIQSRTVARRALQRLGIAPGADEPRRPGAARRALDAARRVLGRPVGPTSGIDPETRLVDGFLQRIRVEPYRSSRLVAIACLHTDAKAATDAANAVAAAYIDFNLEAKYSTTEEAAGFIGRQIETLKAEIDEAERRLQSYGARNRIVTLREGEQLSARKLSDFYASYTATQTDRIRKETRFRALQGAPLEAIPEIVENPLVRELKVTYADLERTYGQKSRTYRPEWPEMQRLRSEMERARERLESESRDLQAKLLQAAEAEYREAVQQERSLSDALQVQKEEAVRVNQGSIEYANLKMEVDNKRNLLKTLLERQSETGLSARLRGLKSSNVRVVDPAELPVFPWRPRVKVNLALGLIAGLGLGVLLALLLDHLDRSVKTVEDLRRESGLPVLGTIPPFSQAGLRYGEVEADGAAATPSAAGPRDPDRPVEIVVLHRPRSSVAEAYRSIRTALLLSAAESAPRAILITSAQPSEGKTVTAVNTAVALVQAGKKVLLLDCDLRRPRLHKVLGIAGDVGLTSCLTGLADPAEAIAGSAVAGLDLLPAGAIPPNPSELLASRAFARLLEHVVGEAGYDHVVIDSPPALVVTDAEVLASLVNGVILVTRAGRVPREGLRHAVEALKRARGVLLGVVLNDVEEGPASGYRYGYRYRYRYRYGSSGAPAYGESGADARAGEAAEGARRRTGGRRP